MGEISNLSINAILNGDAAMTEKFGHLKDYQRQVELPNIRQLQQSSVETAALSDSQQDKIERFMVHIYTKEGYAKHGGSAHTEGGGPQPLSLKSSMNIAKALLERYNNDKRPISLLQVHVLLFCVTHYISFYYNSGRARIW